MKLQVIITLLVIMKLLFINNKIAIVIMKLQVIMKLFSNFTSHAPCQYSECEIYVS